MASPSEAAAARGGERGRRAEQCGYRDWSGLPEPALFSIAMFLTRSLADVLAFGRVCRAWRSVARANERDLMPSLPPLLFFSEWHGDFYCPADGRSCRNGRLAAFLRAEPGFGTVGCSFGHIIVAHWDANAGRETLSIVNPLTVTSTPACRFPPRFGGHARWAALSSPPASPACVLWSSDGYSMDLCRPGDHKWTTFLSREEYFMAPPVFLGDKGYVHKRGNLAAFDVNPCSSSDLTILPMAKRRSLGPYQELRLCVSDAELLLVRAVRSKRSRAVKVFRVYRFDSSVAGWVWLPSLVDRALFWDLFGVTVSENPGRWGGFGSCIYFVDRVDDMLSVFHLKDGKIECLAVRSPSNPRFSLRVPVWIHPSMCY